ncbi:MAG TPA: molybdopterin-binding protein [Burkholderiaceae bacterium]|nr:molybdopterin-binding protein [Burkholderiaceae bacterium]
MTIRKPIASGRRVAPSRRSALRSALASVGGLALAGCDRLSNNHAFVDVLKSAQQLSHGAQRVVAGRKAMAQEFTQADVAAHFKANGTLVPADADYQALMRGQFADWKLQVDGLVEKPAAFTLAELRAMPSRTQITRHDCVEGWSTIGKWKGVPLSHVLDRVRPLPNAKYVVFRCADSMESPSAGRDSRYYESVDMDDAYHVQTVLAYELNDQPLPVNNGAPLRVRIERQLGYKHAKYLMRLELVERFDQIRGGLGGYWEDNGYEWYAGI